MLTRFLQKTVPSRSLAWIVDTQSMLSLDCLNLGLGSIQPAARNYTGQAANKLVFPIPRLLDWPSQSQFRSTLACASSNEAVLEVLEEPASAIEEDSRQDKDSSTKSPSKGKRLRRAESRISVITTGQDTKQKQELTPEQQIYSNLKGIPGVGPVNAELFAKAGYTSVNAVLSSYQRIWNRNEDDFRAHLRDTVGIKHAKFRDLILAYCQKNYTDESFCTLSVEGNISAGKSTFLDGIATFCPDLQNLLHVAPEPVQQWQNVGGKGQYNLLEAFYNEKKRFAYTFQNYIFITRYMQEQKSAKEMQGQPYRLLERSVWCDRMVFVESLKESELLTEMEMTLYHAWFDPLVQGNPTLVPDGFIYLRAAPSTCMDRLKKRSRGEEKKIDMNYLGDLHMRHEKWLYDVHAESGPGMKEELEKAQEALRLELPGEGEKWLLTRALKVQEPAIPDLIKADVKKLNTPNRATAIDGLPALILDCDKDITDISAQQEHAAKVNEYFKYVKEMRKHKADVKSLLAADLNFRELPRLVHERLQDPYEAQNVIRSIEKQRLAHV